jgi:hypothetical protein
VIAALAGRLTAEFGNGFSPRNLAYMRTFFLLYQTRSPILQSAIAKLAGPKNLQSLTANSSSPRKARLGLARSAISPRLPGNLRADASPSRPFSLSWSHYVFLLGIKNPDERSFYEIEAASQDWTVRELKRQFDTSLYERLALSRDKAGIRKLAKKGQLVEKPQDILKEPLVLEFLGLDEQARYSESDLESAIISQIERFPAGDGQGLPVRGPAEALQLRRRPLLRRSRVSQALTTSTPANTNCTCPARKCCKRSWSNGPERRRMRRAGKMRGRL